MNCPIATANAGISFAKCLTKTAPSFSLALALVYRLGYEGFSHTVPLRGESKASDAMQLTLN